MKLSLGATGDRFVKGVFINQTAARAVDDPRAFLHLRKHLAIDQTARFSRQRRVHREEISARIHFIQRRQLDFQIARLFGRDEGIVSDDQHAQRACSRSNDTADASQPDDAESLALELNTDKFLSFPASCFQAAVGLRNGPGQ